MNQVLGHVRALSECLQDARGITPLGVAVGFNRLAIVKLLLSAKAKVDVTDGRGNTPLHYAAGEPLHGCRLQNIWKLNDAVCSLAYWALCRLPVRIYPVPSQTGKRWPAVPASVGQSVPPLPCAAMKELCSVAAWAACKSVIPMS